MNDLNLLVYLVYLMSSFSIALMNLSLVFNILHTPWQLNDLNRKGLTIRRSWRWMISCLFFVPIPSTR